MEDTLIDSETTRTAVKQDLTEAQALGSTYGCITTKYC